MPPLAPLGTFQASVPRLREEEGALPEPLKAGSPCDACAPCVPRTQAC